MSNTSTLQISNNGTKKDNNSNNDINNKNKENEKNNINSEEDNKQFMHLYKNKLGSCKQVRLKKLI